MRHWSYVIQSVRFSDDIFILTEPLLFMNDPRDVPLPRSPSPEDFNLCLSVHEMDNDPELAQLFDLRKCSLAAVQGPPDSPECAEPCSRKSKKKRSGRGVKRSEWG